MKLLLFVFLSGIIYAPTAFGQFEDYYERVRQEAIRAEEERAAQYQRDREDQLRREEQERPDKEQRDFEDFARRFNEEELARRERARKEAPDLNPPQRDDYYEPEEPRRPYQFKVKTFESYEVSDASLSVGSKMNLQTYHGLPILQIDLVIETPGPAKIEIFVQGKSLGSIEADRSDVYKKTLVLEGVIIDRKISNLVLKVEGKATLKKATLLLRSE